MDKDERHREVEKRERLVQTFMIIGAFLVTYSGETMKEYGIIGLIFALYLLITVIYYIWVSRTTDVLTINSLAFLSSYIYSSLILAFLILQSDDFSRLMFVLFLPASTLVFTFSLLSPETSEKINNLFGVINWSKLKVIQIIIYIIFTIGYTSEVTLKLISLI